MQVMLLGFVLLGRSLEERAKLKASSDMNELLVSWTLFGSAPKINLKAFSFSFKNLKRAFAVTHLHSIKTCYYFIRQ